MPIYSRYVHHSVVVWSRRDLRGKHRELCMCWACKKFKPGKEANCDIAQKLFDICVSHALTTPVTECPEFDPKEGLVTDETVE